MYRPGYKEKVVLNISYFPVGNHNFDQVNVQDTNFAPTYADPGELSARTIALNWYVQTVLSRWKKANFQHLQLAGLYWNSEQTSATDPDEIQLLQTAEQLAHQELLPLLWIPYYGANEEDKWRSLGFDAAWIQSNFIEQGANVNVSRIQSAIDTTKNHEMVIEVELTS